MPGFLMYLLPACFSIVAIGVGVRSMLSAGRGDR